MTAFTAGHKIATGNLNQYTRHFLAYTERKMLWNLNISTLN